MQRRHGMSGWAFTFFLETSIAPRNKHELSMGLNPTHAIR